MRDEVRLVVFFYLFSQLFVLPVVSRVHVVPVVGVLIAFVSVETLLFSILFFIYFIFKDVIFDSFNSFVRYFVRGIVWMLVVGVLAVVEAAVFEDAFLTLIMYVLWLSYTVYLVWRFGRFYGVLTLLLFVLVSILYVVPFYVGFGRYLCVSVWSVLFFDVISSHGLFCGWNHVVVLGVVVLRFLVVRFSSGS